jgi:hypothetical protein
MILWPPGKRLMARNVFKPGSGDSKRKVIEASLILKKKMFSLNRLNDSLEFSLEIRYGGGVEKEAGPGCLKKRSLKF